MGSTDCGTALCIMVVSCMLDIGETGRLMQERMKEHDRDIRITRTQNMPTEPDTSRYGTKLNLLTEKAIGTQGKGKIDSTQHKQGQRNRNTGSVDAYNKKTSKPTTHEKSANA